MPFFSAPCFPTLPYTHCVLLIVLCSGVFRSNYKWLLHIRARIVLVLMSIVYALSALSLCVSSLSLSSHVCLLCYYYPLLKDTHFVFITYTLAPILLFSPFMHKHKHSECWHNNLMPNAYVSHQDAFRLLLLMCFLTLTLCSLFPHSSIYSYVLLTVLCLKVCFSI